MRRLALLLLALAAWGLLALGSGGRGLALIPTPDQGQEEASPPPPEAPEGDASQASFVIIAVQDGARYADTFGDPTEAKSPYMSGYLRPQGTLFTRFYNQGLALTNPGHASLLTGTDQRLDNSGFLRPDKPTLFEYHRRHHPSAGRDDGWIISGKSKLAVLSHSRGGQALGATEHAFTAEDDQVWQEVQRVMDQRRPSIIVANFPSTDRRGHEGDWEAYLAAIRNFDRIAYQLWEKTQSSPHYRGKTILVLTNDHGRSDQDWREHGDSSEGSRHIMLLVLGPGIKKGYVSDRERALEDVVPTLGRLLGCPVPEAQGQVMEEALEARAHQADVRPLKNFASQGQLARWALSPGA